MWEYGSESRGKGGKILLAVLCVAAILAAALGIKAFLSRPEGKPQTTPLPSTQATPASDDKSVCGLTATKMSGTLTTAPPTKWTLVGAIAAPEVSKAGPGTVDSDGFRYCYARTPEGAVTMAANLLALGRSDYVGKYIDHLVAAGPGRDKVKRDHETSPDPTTEPPRGVQVAGFRLVSYSGERATVDIAMKAENGVLAYQQFPLVWEDGDWRVVLSDVGDMSSEPVPIDSLQGMVPWSGI